MGMKVKAFIAKALEVKQKKYQPNDQINTHLVLCEISL